MANYVVSDTNLTLIADAIRAKSGHNELLEWPNEYKTSIDNLNPVDMCIKTVTDDVVSVSDAAQYDAKNATIKIKPVQDLHGYDSPWPGGGGENLLDPNLKFPTGTQYGLTLTSADGYTFSYTGTATSSGNIRSSRVNKADAVILPAGTYISKNGTMSLYKTDGSWLRNQYSGSVFTVDEPFYVGNFYWEIVEGCTYNVNSFLALVKGSTAPTSWSPYSNICPISGWTGANVVRTGKNLLDETYRTNTGNNVRFNMLAYYHTFLKGGMSYTISASSSPNQIQIYDETNTRIANKYVSPLTFTPDRDVYVHIDIYYATVPIDGLSAVQVQLELGSTATDYEPYQGTTYDIAFPSGAGTVYGGTLDVVNGMLTVDRAMVDLGTLTWNGNKRFTAIVQDSLKLVGNGTVPNWVCSALMIATPNAVYGNTADYAVSYYGPSLIQARINDITDAATFKTAMSGVQLVYELATPITYTLTPQEIALLRGNNTLWADTGDTTLKYFTTAFEDLAEEIGFAEGGDY